MASTDADGKKRAEILAAARKLIGTPYDQLDCSHFVHKAYNEVDLKFDYVNTAQYPATLIGKFFFKIPDERALPGDLILFSGHVGIYDPDGCKIVNTAECNDKGKSGDMRILSARSGKNLGVEYGRSSWWGEGTFLAWKDFQNALEASQGS